MKPQGGKSGQEIWKGTKAQAPKSFLWDFYMANEKRPPEMKVGFGRLVEQAMISASPLIILNFTKWCGAAFQSVQHSVLCSYNPLFFLTEQQFRFLLLSKARHFIGALGSLPLLSC